MLPEQKAHPIFNLPDELKACRQWVTVAQDKTPHGQWDDPATWLDFETAAQRVREWDCLVAFVVTEDDPYVIIDFDPPKVGDTGPFFQEVVRGPVEALSSYTEWSTSGTGLHTITRGVWPEGKRITTPALGGKVEFFGRKKYVICTGNVLDGMVDVQNGQEVLDFLAEQVGDALGTEPMFEVVREERTTDELIDALFRRAGQDERILNRLRRTFRPERWDEAAFRDAVAAWDTDDNSQAQYAFLCAVAEYTSTKDPDALVALLKASALSRCPITGRCGVVKGGGYNQPTRYDALIYRESIKALNVLRPKLDKQERFIEHGREIATAMLQSWADAQPKPVEIVPQDDTPELSDLFGYEKFVDPDAEGHPRFNDFWNAVYHTMSNRCPEMSLGATIATLSAFMGRRYRFQGTNITLPVILGAPPGGGKTQALNAARAVGGAIIDRECGELNGPGAKQKFRELFWLPSGSVTGSGIANRLTKQPHTLWIDDEALRGIKTLGANEEQYQNAQSEALRANTRQAYDFSVDGLNTSDTGSVAGMERVNDKEAFAPVLGMLWATQRGPLFESLTPEMIGSGQLSRMLFFVPEGKKPRPENMERTVYVPQFSAAFANLVMKVQKSNLDMDGEQTPQHVKAAAFCEIAMDGDAKDIFEQMLHLDVDISDAMEVTHRDELGMLARLAVNITRLAAIAAALDVAEYHAGTYTPTITGRHMRWASTLLVPRVARIVNRWANGEIGSNQHDRVFMDRLKAAIVLCNKEGKYLGGYIPLSAFDKKLKRTKEFKDRFTGALNERLRTQIMMHLADAGEIAVAEVGEAHYPEEWKKRQNRPPRVLIGASDPQ